MSIDWSKLINPAYLLEKQPGPAADAVFGAAIFFALFLIASGFVWLSFVRRERTEPIYKSVRERTVRWLFTTGFVGLILVFFRWQSIPYFGTRIWLVLWLIAAAVWFLFVMNYLLKKFPKERKIDEERKTRERYLPKASASNS